MQCSRTGLCPHTNDIVRRQARVFHAHLPANRRVESRVYYKWANAVCDRSKPESAEAHYEGQGEGGGE